jgi:hypothetical protein
VDLIVEHTHTCYLGDREHRHAWGYGCGTCPACELRARDMLVIADSPEATPRETFLLLEMRGSDLRVRRMSGAPATFSLSPSR